jgi:hypothetical protein
MRPPGSLAAASGDGPARLVVTLNPEIVVRARQRRGAAALRSHAPT